MDYSLITLWLLNVIDHRSVMSGYDGPDSQRVTPNLYLLCLNHKLCWRPLQRKFCFPENLCFSRTANSESPLLSPCCIKEWWHMGYNHTCRPVFPSWILGDYTLHYATFQRPCFHGSMWPKWSHCKTQYQAWLLPVSILFGWFWTSKYLLEVTILHWHSCTVYPLAFAFHLIFWTTLCFVVIARHH